MKTPFSIALLLSMTFDTVAAEMRPKVIHGPTESCLYTFVGDETFVTCDQSVAVIDGLYRKEMAKIEEHEQSEAWRQQVQRKKEAEAAEKLATERAARLKELWATSPNGWACVQKRLPPGATIMDSTDSDMNACAKAFDPPPKRSKK